MHTVFFWTVVLGKTLESPLGCKKIQSIHPKGDQSWVFIDRTDAKAETPIFWPLDAKSWLIGKDRDAGKDWGQEEKGTTEDEMVRWHHWLNGHGSGWTPGVGDGREAWRAAVMGSQSQTWKSDWTELTLFSGHNAVVHLIDDSTVYFMYTEKPKQLCESIYCHIYFISVAWSQTHDTSKVCIIAESLCLFVPKLIDSSSSPPWTV